MGYYLTPTYRSPRDFRVLVAVQGAVRSKPVCGDRSPRDFRVLVAANTHH